MAETIKWKTKQRPKERPKEAQLKGNNFKCEFNTNGNPINSLYSQAICDCISLHIGLNLSINSSMSDGIKTQTCLIIKFGQCMEHTQCLWFSHFCDTLAHTRPIQSLHPLNYIWYLDLTYFGVLHMGHKYHFCSAHLGIIFIFNLCTISCDIPCIILATICKLFFLDLCKQISS